MLNGEKGGGKKNAVVRLPGTTAAQNKTHCSDLKDAKLLKGQKPYILSEY